MPNCVKLNKIMPLKIFGNSALSAYRPFLAFWPSPDESEQSVYCVLNFCVLNVKLKPAE